MTGNPVPRILSAGLLAATLWQTGCDRAGDSRSQSQARHEVALPRELEMLFGPLEGAPIGIAEARRSASDGERVLVRGMVGGRVDPFVDRRAVMLLVDEALPVCNDHCKTPWDMCCERPDTIRENSATVQVVDDAGQPLHSSLRGHAGLGPMATVVVSGTVRRDSAGMFLITAERMSVASASGAPAATCCPHH